MDKYNQVKMRICWNRKGLQSNMTGILGRGEEVQRQKVRLCKDRGRSWIDAARGQWKLEKARKDSPRRLQALPTP